MICYLFSGDIYLYFGISISFSSVFEYSYTECNSFRYFEILLSLSATLLPIKSLVASAVF